MVVGGGGPEREPPPDTAVARPAASGTADVEAFHPAPFGSRRGSAFSPADAGPPAALDEGDAGADGSAASAPRKLPSRLGGVEVLRADRHSRSSVEPSPRRIVIDQAEEIPTRYKKTRRAYAGQKRSLTHRIRQLRDEEHELKMYEMLVSRSLQDLGVERSEFDSKVQERTGPEVRELHRQMTCHGGHWTADERFKLASSFAKLAVWRIDPGSIEWARTRARSLFVVAHDPRWRWGVRACLAIYLALIWVEQGRTSVPPAALELGGKPWAWWMQLLEGVAACGLLADLAVSFGYQRVETLLESRQNYLRAFIALSCFVDYLLALGTYHATGGRIAYVRWSRPLRLLYLPFADKASFNSVLSILDTLPTLGDLLLLGLVVTFIWAVIGVSALANADLRASHAGDDSNAFDSFDVAFVALATLLTGENFPNVMWPALNYEPATAAFFFSFVLVGTIMIMPATVAIVFEYYKRFHGLKVLEEKMIERRCLLMAFALVDEDNSGSISFHEYAKLSSAVHPDSSAAERSLLYKLLDSDGSASVSAAEFVRLSDVLLLGVKADSHELTRRWPFLKRRVPRIRALIENPWFERSVLLCIVLYVTLLALQAHPGTHARALASNSAEALVDALFVVLFALEVALKMAGLSIAGYFSDTWNRIDFCVIVASVMMVLIRSAISSLFAAGVLVLAPARAVRLLRILRTIRTISIFSHSHKLRTLTRLFVQMRPVIVTILGTILMILYAYLVIGIEAFKGKAVYSAEERQACGAYCPSFDSPLLATITLAQLVLASNWPELTYALRGDGGVFLTWLYLVSFVLLTNAIMLPLLSALILEIYSMETDKMVARSSSENQLATLFPQDALWRQQGGVGADKYVVVLSNGVRTMFERYDTDASGSISALELGKLLADLGERLSTAELKEVLGTLDVDANGHVSFGEFLAWWQRYGLEKCFRRFDVDDSGTIDATELGALMAEVSSGVALSAEELDLAVAELDKDGSGAIGFDEYASWFGDFDVRKVFSSFDKDNSGLISRPELEQILAHMGFELSQAELKAALQRLDSDEDGGISFDEFLPWWKELQRSKEEKTFMVEHDRGRRWEENLFLRKRDDNGLATMLQESGTEGERGGARDDSSFVRGALLRRIAADADAGVELTADYLLARYSTFDASAARAFARPQSIERPVGRASDERASEALGGAPAGGGGGLGGGGGFGGSGACGSGGAGAGASGACFVPKREPSHNSANSLLAAGACARRTSAGASGASGATSPAAAAAAAVGESPERSKFDSFPTILTRFAQHSPRRRSGRASSSSSARHSGGEAGAERKGSGDRAMLPGAGSRRPSAGLFGGGGDAAGGAGGSRARVSPASPDPPHAVAAAGEA